MTTEFDIDVPKLLDLLNVDAHPVGGEWRGYCPHPAHRAQEGSSAHLRSGPGTWMIVSEGEKLGLHHCFSCGWGGSPVDLVSTLNKIHRRQARLWLLKMFGSSVPGEVRTRDKLKEGPGRASGLLRLPRGAISPEALRIDPRASQGLSYLEHRSVTPEEIQRHRIHVVPNEPGQDYRGRVVVPVYVRRRLVDFVARTYLTDLPDTVPKALSGRKAEGADKDKVLWGYDHLDLHCSVVHVVEGVWGALALLRAGVKNVVAACGSNWSPGRTELLNPWETVILIPDGDEAGSKLERRASALRFNHRVRVVDLPAGIQPDDLPSNQAEETISQARTMQINKLERVVIKDRRKGAYVGPQNGRARVTR